MAGGNAAWIGVFEFSCTQAAQHCDLNPRTRGIAYGKTLRCELSPGLVAERNRRSTGYSNFAKT